MASSRNQRKTSLQLFIGQWSDMAWLGTYLGEEERVLVAAMAREYRRRLRKAEGGASLATLMRLEGVLMLYVLARRVGLAALGAGLERVDAGSAAGKKDGFDGEDVGKAQERLRKALKELDDSLTQPAASVAGGLADLLRPLLKEAEGVLEGSLQRADEPTASFGTPDRAQGNGRTAKSLGEPAFTGWSGHAAER